MFIELIQNNQFIIRAIIGGSLVGVLCAILGVFVTLKKESFIADAIAHASLAGVALALLISIEPFFIAMIVGIIMAIGITYFKKNSKISGDAIIGIFFSIIFAIGILLLNLSDTYKPELQSYLFGSIALVNWNDIFYSFIIFSISILTITYLFPQILYSTFDPEAAYIRGINVNKLEYILNILIAVTTIVSIKIIGIILVTALLIIPSTTAKILAKNFNQMIPISISISLISSTLGLVLAYNLDVPPGAMIVITSGVIFFVVFILKKFIPSTIQK
jgi:zinc transport system permease protein